VSLFRELIGVFGILQRSLRVPASLVTLAFFIVFGGGAMGMCGKVVLLGSLPMCFVHDISPVEIDSALLGLQGGYQTSLTGKRSAKGESGGLTVAES
jgi:hypothetical protein